MNSKFCGKHRHGCVLSFLYLNLSTVIIASLKLTLSCDIFVGISDRIQYHFWGAGPEKRQRLMSLLISISQNCWLLPQSCENIVWISFKKMYGKLLPPPLVVVVKYYPSDLLMSKLCNIPTGLSKVTTYILRHSTL